MMAARQIFLGRGGAKKVSPPAGWRFVEYLQAPASNYATIDTGVEFDTQDYSFSTTAALTVALAEQTKSYPVLFQGSGFIFRGIKTGNYFSLRVGSVDRNFSTMPSAGAFFTVSVTPTSASLDNETVNINTVQSDGNNLFLFASPSAAYNMGLFRIAECTISKGGALVRHLLPVANESNVGAMYDVVSKTIIYNGGTVPFVIPTAS